MTKKVDERIKNIKIFIDDKSVELQKKLFDLGAEWRGTKTEIMYDDKYFFFVDENGMMAHSNNLRYYFHSDYQEIKVDEILCWEPQHDFEPFEKVLVRNSNSERWVIDLYSHFDNTHICLKTAWHQCIPYKGNEHLLGKE